VETRDSIQQLTLAQTGFAQTRRPPKKTGAAHLDSSVTLVRPELLRKLERISIGPLRKCQRGRNRGFSSHWLTQ